MPSLPAEVALRRVTVLGQYDDGSWASGQVVLTAVAKELVFTPPGGSSSQARSLFTKPHTVNVVNGLAVFPDGVLCRDDPTLSGAGVYTVHRTWLGRDRDYNVVVTRGATGTTADAPLDLSSLTRSTGSGLVGVVSGPPGTGIASITVDSGDLLIHLTDGTTTRVTIGSGGGATPAGGVYAATYATTY